MKTLFLQPDSWDLALDTEGNIAVADKTYQQAQDIASACRTFSQDMYFNQFDGIPYLDGILGKSRYPLSLYRKYLTDAAISVAGVIEANVELYVVDDRLIGGQIKFTNDSNKTGVISL